MFSRSSLFARVHFPSAALRQAKRTGAVLISPKKDASFVTHHKTACRFHLTRNVRTLAADSKTPLHEKPSVEEGEEEEWFNFPPVHSSSEVASNEICPPECPTPSTSATSESAKKSTIVDEEATESVRVDQFGKQGRKLHLSKKTHRRLPIEELSLTDTQPWRVLTKVVAKSLTRVTGVKRLRRRVNFRCTLADDSAAVEAIVDDGLQLNHLLKVDSFYEIYGTFSDLRPADAAKTTLSHRSVILLREEMVRKLKKEYHHLVKTVDIPYNFTPLRELVWDLEVDDDHREMTAEPMALDLVGVVVGRGEMVTAKWGDSLRLTLSDFHGTRVTIVLCGKQAREFDRIENRRPVVAFRNAKFHPQKSDEIFLFNHGSFEVNPSTAHPAVAKLHERIRDKVEAAKESRERIRELYKERQYPEDF